MTYAIARAAAAEEKALRDAGFHYLGTFEDGLRELLRRGGFQGRERGTRWNDEAGCCEPQRWYPLWAAQVVVWLTPDDRVVARREPAATHRERLVVEALRALAHDREARAAVQAVATMGRDQVLTLLRRIGHLALLRRHPWEVWDGVCTSPAFGCGLGCACIACSMDIEPTAEAFNQHPHTAIELRTSELHPDDQELLDSGVPVVVLDLCIGDEP